MDGGNNEEKAELNELLGTVWNRIVRQVNRLIETHDKFDFVAFKENLNPTLEEVLQGFAFVDFALTQLYDSKLLEPGEARIVLNSKQCILKMRELGIACDRSDQDEYTRVIRDLKLQCTL